MPQIQLVFLGTGGGRFAIMTQKRRTGGIRFLGENLNVHLDPGPGALVYSIEAGLDLQKLRAVMISHCHPDHYNDAEVFIEAMTQGMTKKRGVVVAPRSVLHGNGCGPSISRYHQQMPERVIEVRPGASFDLGELTIVATEARHTDPEAVGFRFETKDIGDIAYTSDTEYFEGIGELYKGVRLLMLCTMRPSGKPWKGHMTTDDAVKIVEEARPEMAVLTHFGMQMIFRGPANEAKLVEQRTSVPTIPASDGMRINVGAEIRLQKPERKQRGLNEFRKR